MYFLPAEAFFFKAGVTFIHSLKKKKEKKKDLHAMNLEPV